MGVADDGLLVLINDNYTDLFSCLGFAVAWLLLRLIFYSILRRYWKSNGKGDKDIGLQEKILEEGFAIVGAVVGVTVGWQAYQTTSQVAGHGGCGLGGTHGCFRGWPHHTGPRAPAVALFHNVELGWYLHYLIKHELGMGMQDNLQMHLHHASTITLLLMSYLLNLHRPGVLILVLLNMSNPFLHVAKVAHYMELPTDKLAFLAFAVAFFLTRIVAFPLLLLRATLFHSKAACPSFLGAHLPVYVTANALLLGLQVMQVQWFMGIIRLLRQAVGGSSEGFKREGQAHDYAKVSSKGEGGSDLAMEASPAASSPPGVNGGSGKGGLHVLADVRNGVAAAKGASALIKTGRVQ